MFLSAPVAGPQARSRDAEGPPSSLGGSTPASANSRLGRVPRSLELFALSQPTQADESRERAGARTESAEQSLPDRSCVTALGGGVAEVEGGDSGEDCEVAVGAGKSRELRLRLSRDLDQALGGFAGALVVGEVVVLAGLAIGLAVDEVVEEDGESADGRVVGGVD